MPIFNAKQKVFGTTRPWIEPWSYQSESGHSTTRPLSCLPAFRSCYSPLYSMQRNSIAAQCLRGSYNQCLFVYFLAPLPVFTSCLNLLPVKRDLTAPASSATSPLPHFDFAGLPELRRATRHKQRGVKPTYLTARTNTNKHRTNRKRESGREREKKKERKKEMGPSGSNRRLFCLAICTGIDFKDCCSCMSHSG